MQESGSSNVPAEGLVIKGGSNELLWKGNAVATKADIDAQAYSLATSKSSTNGNVKLNLNSGSSTKNSITFKGTGAATVTTDSSGVVSIGTSVPNISVTE